MLIFVPDTVEDSVVIGGSFDNNPVYRVTLFVELMFAKLYGVAL
jgi:hypothetical protein